MRGVGPWLMRNQGCERVWTWINWEIEVLRGFGASFIEKAMSWGGLDLDLLRNQGLEGVGPSYIEQSKSWEGLDLDLLRNQDHEEFGPQFIEESMTWESLDHDLLRYQSFGEGVGPWLIEKLRFWWGGWTLVYCEIKVWRGFRPWFIKQSRSWSGVWPGFIEKTRSWEGSDLDLLTNQGLEGIWTLFYWEIKV